MSKPARFNNHTTIRYNWHQFAALAQPLTTSPHTLSTIEPTMPFWLLQTCTTERRSQCQSLDAWTLARSHMIGDDWANDWAVLLLGAIDCLMLKVQSGRSRRLTYSMFSHNND